MTDKSSKFVEFYLSELLNHVKRMSEQRFPPADYQRIKRLIAFILADSDPVKNIARLQEQTSLLPVYELLDGIIKRVSSPDFRKGEMLSNIEMESQKLSHVIAVILKQNRDGFVADFGRLGIHMDLPATTPTVSPAAEIDAPAVKEKASLPKGATPFSNVEDMVGFFKRREESGESADPAEESSLVSGSGGTSELTEHLKNLENAVNQLKTNFTRIRYVVEVGQAFERIARNSSSREIAGHVTAAKSALDRIADMLDDNRTEFTIEAFELVSVLMQRTLTLPGSSDSRFIDFKTALNKLVNHFEPGSQQSERRLRIDFTAIDASDVRIFRDDSKFQLNRLRDALERLKSGQSAKDSLQDAYQCLRSIGTSSRLLKLDVLVDQLTPVISFVQRAEMAPDALSGPGVDSLLSFVSHLTQLIDGNDVPESALIGLRDRFEKPADEKAAKEIEEEKTEIAVEAAASEPESKPLEAARPESASTGANDWMEGLQTTIDQHPYALKSAVMKISDEKVETEAAPAEETPVQHGESEAISEFIRETEETRAQVRPVPAEPVKDDRTAKVEDELVNLMAAGDTDLTDYKIRQFTEKLEVEPQNIIQPRSIRGKRRRKESKKTDDTKEAALSPAEFILEETNFESIDAEILDIFVQESDDYLKALDKSADRLASNINDEAALKEVERSSHSLKSSSRMLGLARISSLAAAIELIAERCNEKELEFSEDLRALMTHAVDITRRLIDKKPAEATALVTRLAQLEKQLSAPNIFIGSIPGASGFLETLPESERPVKIVPKPKARAEEAKPVSPPAPVEAAPAEVPVAEAMTSGPGYFEKIGVDEEIVEIFKEEAGSYLKLMMTALDNLKNDLTHRAAMRDIEKSAHSLRSSTKMLGFQKISNVVRPIEGIAERVNKHTLAANEHLLEVLGQAAEAIRMLVDGTDVVTEPLIAELNAIELTTETTVAPPETKTAEKPKAEKKARPAKKRRKSGKAQSAYFADIQFTTDPILRQLDKGGSTLLEEMSQSSV